MIAQARITSDTYASVHLDNEVVEVEGADLSELRAHVKQVFITAAQIEDSPLDVVILEPDVRHHLRVEPSGRISPREPGEADENLPKLPADDRPASLQPSGGAAATPTGRVGHSAVSPWAGDASADTFTGEFPVARTHRAGRRRAHGAPASGVSAPSSMSAPSSVSAPSSLSASSAPSASPAPSGAPSPSARPASAFSPSAPPADTGDTWRARTADEDPAEVPGPLSPTTAPSSSLVGTAPTKNELVRQRGTDDARPTLKDLQTSTARKPKAKASKGWRGFLTRATGGVIAPRPGKKEQYEIDRLERIRRPLDGPRNIVVVNLKGGAHKTTASLMIAATLGVTRGGNVLAWDNNETRGTLGWRGIPTDHTRTAVDLLHDLDRMRSPQASAADLDPFMRPQGAMRFDILASDEDPGSAASIDAEAFTDLNDTLSRFYRIKVIDTGNNVRASNWMAAVQSADQLVIISTVREDTFNAAAWMIDELRATGLHEQVDHAVTVLSHSSKGSFDPVLRTRLKNHFGAHTRAVTEVPYEQQFVDGSHLDWNRVSNATKEAWLDATALIIDGM